MPHPETGAGDIIGLDTTILEFVRNYKPGELGVCYIDPYTHVVLEVPDWSIYSWASVAVANLSAGQSSEELVFTVPTNERAYLRFLFADRESGDNEINIMRVTLPDGYRVGTGAINLVNLTTPAATVFWPDKGGRQVVQDCYDDPPILLEPGSTIGLLPNGAGVAATAYNVQIAMTRTKLVRSQDPSS